MEWVVTTGRTVDEAKDAALDELGVDEHDAEFEILEEPKVGLFGRLRGEARVRARVRPNVPRPKSDRRDRRKRRGDGSVDRSGTPADGAADRASPGDGFEADARPGRGAAGAGRAERGDAAPARTGRSGGPRDAAPTGGVPPVRALAGSGAPSEGDDAAVDDAENGVADDPGTSGRGPRRRRRSRGSRSGGGPALAAEDGSDDDDDGTGYAGDDGGMMGEQELDLAQQAEVAEAFVRGLLERFSVSADTTTVTLDDETIEVQVSGSELGLLIGPKGQTLQAVQEMTRTAVQRRASNRTGRILVDVAGYRVKRREALERFTRQIADDVRASGVQRVLEPMSPADRKIVHDTANLIPGVRTISEGEEPQRRVVIVPDAGDQNDAAAADA